ncbi:MAG TPA: agmatinase [Kofleriaceae bacterium]|nr:agmatinase [Kofleriaceae bacterium]
MSQASASSYLRHGQTPFFRLPSIDFASPERERYRAFDAIVLGVPHDGGTTYLPGARLGPYHVRRVSALVESYHPGHGLDVFGTIRVADGGNVVFPPFDRGAMREAVQQEIVAIAASGAAPFVVGGDHSITLPILRAIAKVHGPVALIHVDAHLDTSTAETWGDDLHHGTPIRHAIAEGLIAPRQLHQIALRGPWKDHASGELATAHGGVRVTADDLGEIGATDLVADLHARIGERPVYVSFDIDAIDPAFAPGTGTPVPGGITSREALRLVRELGGCRLVGMDVVEVAPALDHADITCHLAAHLVYEGLAVHARRF